MNKPIFFSATKIVCTLGPASESVERLVELIRAGMDVARLNFSHGSHDSHREVLGRLRTAAAETGEAIAILQDLSGPKIRIGEIAGGTVELETGQQLILTTEEVAGTRHRVSTAYKALAQDVVRGNTILLDDGRISLQVESVQDGEVICTVRNGGPLS